MTERAFRPQLIQQLLGSIERCRLNPSRLEHLAPSARYLLLGQQRRTPYSVWKCSGKTAMPTLFILRFQSGHATDAVRSAAALNPLRHAAASQLAQGWAARVRQRRWLSASCVRRLLYDQNSESYNKS